MSDFDVFELSAGDGKLYLGSERSASYLRVRPGCISVHLESRTEVHDGLCNQGDKAVDICRAWVEDGRVVEIGGFKAGKVEP